jgi:hypothetical protein
MSSILKEVYDEFMISTPMKLFHSAPAAPYISEHHVLQKIVYKLPDSNIIFFEYPLFKQYCHSMNVKNIVPQLFSLIDSSLMQTQAYELHINLRSFSITSVEQNMTLIQAFMEKFKSNILYKNNLTKLYIYHTPTVMKQIIKMLSMFKMEGISQKCVYYDKDESNARIEQLFS